MLKQEDFNQAFQDIAKTCSSPDWRIEEQKDICWYWVSGGQSGGSCWDEGDSHHYPVAAKEPPASTPLDELFEKIIPSITFLHYKKIMREGIETSSYSQNENYGNHTDYCVKTVRKEVLLAILQQLGYVE